MTTKKVRVNMYVDMEFMDNHMTDDELKATIVRLVKAEQTDLRNLFDEDAQCAILANAKISRVKINYD